ncbi:MAG: hypothetical protein F6K19_20785 [Cyanothece sp. SIO1E1]|nr:hypothetical protein [Cyanothece sp. SIO1E1]
MNGMLKGLLLPSIITTSIISAALLPVQARATEVFQNVEVGVAIEAEDEYSPLNTELEHRRRRRHHHDEHHHDGHHHHKKKKFFFGRR